MWDNKFTATLAKNDFKLSFLRISIGVIYIWFGALKFFPQMSPAEEIAQQTISFLTFGMLPANIGYLTLAIWEIAIGFLLIFNWCSRLTVGLTLVHMFFTFTPLFVFSAESFVKPPFVFSLLGQYILKNIVIIAALFMIYPCKQENKLNK